MSIKITSYKTFGVKRFMTICKDDRFDLYNIFGFGLWIIKDKQLERSWKL